MNSNIELILNGKLLDGCDDIPIQLERSVKQIQEPATCTGEFTLDFDIPGTQNNNIIFEHIFEINSQTNYNPNGNNTAELKINSIPVFDGKMQLNHIKKNINRDQNEIDYYNVTLYGYTKALYVDARNKYLQDLTFDEYTPHYPNYTTIVDTWSYPNTTSPYGCYYPLIDYNVGFEYYTTFYNSALLNDMIFPAVFVKVIWDKIFSTHGYRYKSKFLESAQFNNLIVPYSNEKNLTVNCCVSAYTSADLMIPTSDLSPFDTCYWDVWQRYFNNTTGQAVERYDYVYATWVTSMNNTGWFFVAPRTGTYHVEMTIIYEVVNNPTLLSIVKTTGPSDVGIHEVNWVLDTTQTYYLNYNVEMQYGQYLLFPTSTYDVTSPWRGYIKQGSTLNITYGTVAEFDPNVHLEDLMVPNIQQTEFLDGINKMFNLYWETDGEDPTLINIEPYENYYNKAGTGTTFWNWNYKINLDEEIEYSFLGDIGNNVVNFKYQDAEDYLGSEYKDTNILEYGQKQVIYTGNSFTEQNETDIECEPFQPSVVDKLSSLNPLTHFIIPKYWTGSMSASNNWDNLNTDIGLRILVTTGTRPVGGGMQWIFGPMGYTSYPYAGHEKYPFDPTNVNNQDLNYDSKNLYYDTSPTNKNLYNQYWKSYYDNFNKPENRLLKGWVNLDETDMYKLKMSDTIILFEAFWRINLLKYNVGEKLHEVELIKILDDLDYSMHPVYTTSYPYVISQLTVPKHLEPSIWGSLQDSVIDGTNLVVMGRGNKIANWNTGITTEHISIFGEDNEITSGTKYGNIFGSGNKIVSGATNVTIFGSGVTATQSNSFYVSGDIYLNNISLSATSVWERGSGYLSVQTIGTGCRATNSGSTALGYATCASGFLSYAEGNQCSATTANDHAEGNRNLACGGDSHAEGHDNIASGFNSHAEGFENEASGDTSHVEGRSNKVYGVDSHVEGRSNRCWAEWAHIAGYTNYLYSGATGSAMIACHNRTGNNEYTLYTNNINILSGVTMRGDDGLNYALTISGGTMKYTVI